MDFQLQYRFDFEGPWIDGKESEGYREAVVTENGEAFSEFTIPHVDTPNVFVRLVAE